MTAVNTIIVIRLADGRTLPMTPPAELGAAFAAVIADAVSWTPERRLQIDDVYEYALFGDTDEGWVDTYDAASDRIEAALGDAGLG